LENWKIGKLGKWNVEALVEIPHRLDKIGKWKIEEPIIPMILEEIGWVDLVFALCALRSALCNKKRKITKEKPNG